ncbi:MAG: HpcH/HpaI aldolase/citrate lyase family protein [Akkermansiaceae bacterium]|nr:HpcH/HpaI aldolase/citrate lyase family protein [Akkermansiaceae bacterium]
MNRLHSDLTMLAPMFYVPGDRSDLHEILGGNRNLGVCSLVVCLEDAVRSDNRKSAADALRRVLDQLRNIQRPIYVRPADTEALDWMLENLPMDKIAGFVLPKASASAIHQWIEMSLGLHTIIPILETRDALDPSGRRDLALACAAHPSQIPGARIGANDLFSLLGGLRRPRNLTVYETPVGSVIDSLLEAFCAQGVRLCAPVCDRISDLATLERELQEDIHRGLFAKTAIHPSQVEAIWKSYEPSADDLDDARRILHPDAPAVFRSNGDMLEPACHSEWARRLIVRDSLYRSASQISPKSCKRRQKL